ncbi:MAG: serine/threonine protein phosphatase [Acetobacteraceae bacterium]|nr:serine/threonine protein phosphatase [Acetobacteraceae bacterium]
MSWLRRLIGRHPVEPVRRVVPPGIRVYAVGDVHGRLDCLLALERRIADDVAARGGGRSLVIYLGDLIDRGPDSAGVLTHLASAAPAPFERRFLRGNHERMFESVLDAGAGIADWKTLGGLDLMASYGVSLPAGVGAEADAALLAALRRSVPLAHLRLLSELETLIVVGDYVFVHAGLRPGVPLGQQTEADLLWIRDEFLQSRADFGRTVVHGHTPVAEPERRPNRINVDTGAYATGRLTAVRLEGEDVEMLSVWLQ